PRDDRRPVHRPARLSARGPGEQELIERRVHLETGGLEDVCAVLEDPMLGEQAAEVADRVPPGREEPIVAEELVLLDVGEDRPREREQVVEALPRLVVEQRALIARQALAR